MQLVRSCYVGSAFTRMDITASGPEGPVHNNLGVEKISPLSSPVFLLLTPSSNREVQL